MNHHCVEPGRYHRQGFPEAVYCPGKTARQIIQITRALCAGNGPVLLTRAEPRLFKTVRAAFPAAKHYPVARIIVVRGLPRQKRAAAYICVITAGTTDIPVAEEAAVTAEALGHRVERIYDAGVAGVHRLLQHQGTITAASCAVVCAGMEGALASVAGGLARCPVIGVPTSVGYGAAFGGIAALLAMLNSCAPNVSVVNIDDGFGAGIIASLINAGRGAA
jgi:NCAIR mutase (PurE)-related protein